MATIFKRAKSKLANLIRHYKSRQEVRPVKKNSGALKWGVIGTGYMGNVMVKALNKSKDDIVFAVLSRTEPKAREFGNKYKIPFQYHDLKDFLSNTEIDIIYIATPLDTHYAYIKASLEAGKNVLCEKPMVKSLEEIDELQKIAATKNCFFMEGLWSRLLPTYALALEWIRKGEIGEVEYIKVEKARLKNYLRTDKKVQSVIWDYGIYPLSFVLMFLKDPKIVDVLCKKNPEGLDTDWHIFLEEGKVKAGIDISGRYNGESKAFIIGSKGTIEFGNHFNRSNVVKLYDLSRRLRDEREFSYISEGFEYEIDEVNKQIKRGNRESEEVSLEYTKKGIRLVNQLIEQAR